MTAKHVVQDSGVGFRFGARFVADASFGFYEDIVCKETKCFVSKKYDFALVKADIVQNNLLSNLKINTLPISEYIFDTPKKGWIYKMYHYPLGVSDQRFNSGKLVQEEIIDNLHCMSSLPGSSGAPIFYNNKVIGIHTGKGEKLSNTHVEINIQGIKEYVNIYKNNEFISLSKIDMNNLTQIR